MKPQVLNRFLIKQLLAAACITSAAYAATATKSGSGTDLTLDTSWSGGSGPGFPTSADVATWDTSSLGAGLTADSDMNWGSITITGALSNIDITGLGILTTGNITLAGSQPLSIANGIDLSGSSIYDIADVTGTTATDATISGSIYGTVFGITKTGAGTLTLSGANSYTATTTINSGVLAISKANALGTGNVGIDGGTLRINNNAFTSGTANIANTLSVSATKTGVLDMIGNGVNANPLTLNTGNITVDGTLKITRSSGNYGTTNDGAQFSGSGVLEIGDTNSGVTPANGSNTQGRLWMRNANAFDSFTGSVHILTNGNLTLFGPSAATNSGQLVNGNDVTIDAGGYLSLLGFTGGSGISTIGNLNGGGTITRNSGSTTAAILRAAGGNFTGSFNTAVLALNTSINLEKIGAGTLTLSGANTAPGTTTIKNGSIVLSGGNDRLVVSGSVILGDTSTSGKLVLGDATAASNQTLAGLTTTGLGGSVVGALATTDSLLTLNIASPNTFGGMLGGAGANENKLALTKTGAGALILSGTNSYTGATTLNGGTLQFAKVSLNAGTTPSAANFTVASGATAAFNVGGAGEFDATDIGNLIALTNVVSGTPATQGFKSGSKIGLDTTNTTGGVFSYAGNITDHSAGVTTDTLGLVKLGIGTLTLAGTNTYTGTTTIAAGTLEFSTAANQTLPGIISGAGALTKSGNGALTLSGGSTYTGATTVNNGALLANNTTGSATGTGSVTVKATATLGGTGAVSGAVILESGGTLAPGASIESLATGALTLPAGAALAAEIDSSGSPAADVVNVTGNVSLGGDLTVTDIAGVPAAITLGTKLTLITYSGSLTGTFAGKAEASTFAVGANTFKIRYADGGAVTLEAVAAGASYSSWAGTNAPSQTAVQDYDNDGISNGLEYVLGGLASSNDRSKLPTVSTAGGTFVFSFVRNQASKTSDTAVSIQVGTDLATWASYPVPATGALGPILVSDNLNGTDTVTLTVPQAPDAKKFARLNVVITP